LFDSTLLFKKRETQNKLDQHFLKSLRLIISFGYLFLSFLKSNFIKLYSYKKSWRIMSTYG